MFKTTEKSTMVIHPTDPTTDFMIPIYEGKGWDVHRDNMDEKFLLKEAEKYDRLVMLGHGCKYGLFTKEGMNFTQPLQGLSKGHGLVVNSNWVELLKEKDCTALWCWASNFAKQHDLKGFFTGMFISEVYEAGWFKIDTTQEEVDYQNYLFSESLGRHIFKDDVLELVHEEYQGEGPIIAYNKPKLYFN